MKPPTITTTLPIPPPQPPPTFPNCHYTWHTRNRAGALSFGFLALKPLPRFAFVNEATHYHHHLTHTTPTSSSHCPQPPLYMAHPKLSRRAQFRVPSPQPPPPLRVCERSPPLSPPPYPRNSATSPHLPKPPLDMAHPKPSTPETRHI